MLDLEGVKKLPDLVEPPFASASLLAFLRLRHSQWTKTQKIATKKVTPRRIPTIAASGNFSGPGSGRSLGVIVSAAFFGVELCEMPIEVGVSRLIVYRDEDVDVVVNVENDVYVAMGDELLTWVMLCDLSAQLLLEFAPFPEGRSES